MAPLTLKKWGGGGGDAPPPPPPNLAQLIDSIIMCEVKSWYSEHFVN